MEVSIQSLDKPASKVVLPDQNQLTRTESLPSPDVFTSVLHWVHGTDGGIPQGPPQEVGVSQGPPQGAGVSQGPPQEVGVSQGPPQKVGVSQGPPQGAGVSQGPPQEVGVSQDPPQEVGVSQGPPQGAGNQNQNQDQTAGTPSVPTVEGETAAPSWTVRPPV
uniref:Uncharacterized protein n=1 Tax=Nothobranchius furzeri TaxID=105023 RepID=A0A8C6PN74_NOTFU